MHSALRQRPDRVLRIPRRADLPHNGDVERRSERTCYLGADRHASPRDRNHDGALLAQAQERCAEQPPSVTAGP